MTLVVREPAPAKARYNSRFTRDRVLPGGRNIIDALWRDIHGDNYAVIVGDDTSGRFFTLLIGLAINRMRRRHGQRALPILFIEGIGQTHNKAQIKAFGKFLPALAALDHAKRALIVTDNVSSGLSTGSIAWRLNEAGFACDVASLSGIDSVKGMITNGYWPPGTRGFGANGDAMDLVDEPLINGLRQRTGGKDRKFSDTYSLVLTYRDDRRAMARHRHDVHVAADQLADRLDNSGLVVWEIEQIAPAMCKLAKQLRKPVRRDEYRGIVAEDRAGRIPALVIGKAINVWRAAHGRAALPIIFVPPGKSDKAELDQRYRLPLRRMQGGRALLFAGPMHSGATTGPIASWLHGNGVAVDIITPGDPDSPCDAYIRHGVLPADARITHTYRGDLQLHTHREVTGVRRDHGRIAVARGAARREVGLARAAVRELIPSVTECLR